MSLEASPVALTRPLQQLVQATMPLVQTIAARRHRRAPSVGLDELVAIGYAVLVEMAPQHDPERGRFDAFVALRVHGAMLDLIRTRLKQRRRADLSSLALPNAVREASMDEAMQPGNDVAEVLESVEIAIVGYVASYVGGTNSNWAEDEAVDRVQREQAARAIHDFADSLREPEQTVFRDHFLAGVRVVDVAAKVQRSPRSIERTLQDLRAQLRKHLIHHVLA